MSGAGALVKAARKLAGTAVRGNSVFRARWAGEAGFDRAEVEFDDFLVVGLRGTVTPEVLRAGVGLQQRRVACGGGEVADGFGIPWKEPHRGAVFRRHVGDGGSVGQRQGVEAGATEFDDGGEDAVAAEAFGEGQDDVGADHAGAAAAGQAAADDAGNEQRDAFSQHGSGGFDAADSPAEDAERVDHRGVRVHADEAVGEGFGAGSGGAGGNDGGEVFEVQLVDNAVAGGNDAQVVVLRLAQRTTP